MSSPCNSMFESQGISLAAGGIVPQLRLEGHLSNGQSLSTFTQLLGASEYPIRTTCMFNTALITHAALRARSLHKQSLLRSVHIPGLFT